MDWSSVGRSVGRSTGRSTGARSLLAVLAGTLVLFTQAAPARAGDDSGCHSVGVGDIPADGAGDVVRNPMIVVERLTYDWHSGWGAVVWDIALRDASDNEILAYVFFLEGSDCVPAYFPESLLEPDTTYDIYSQGVRLSTFSTGTLVDQQDPDFELGPDDESSGLHVDWTGSPDIVMITMRVGSSLGSQGIAMSAANPINEASWAMDDGDMIQLTAWDRAGNSTTQAVRLRIPGGCHTGTGLRSPMLFALLLLFGLGCRRARGLL